MSCQQTSTTSTPPATPTPTTTLAIREIDSPAGTDSREPELYATTDGRIIFSWVEKIGEQHHALRYTVRDAKGWSEPRRVAEGDDWFVNWADFPSVVAQSPQQLTAHWLVKSGSSTYAYDVNVARSEDGGATWSKPVVPHTDKTKTEHGFVSLLPQADGRVGAVWLDGRNFKDVKGESDDHHAPSPVSMTLRYANIDEDSQLSDEALLDERVCECCQTAAAFTSDGAIVVYRDRSEREVRDIYFVRLQNGSWSKPQPVHVDDWEISACPVNGPTIAADGRRVAVAWYTEAGDKPRVQIAFSNDAGATFGEATQVDDGNAVGRADVLLLRDGSALVCWLSGTAEGGAVKVRRIHPDGKLDPVAVVAKSSIARSSGFPRMARLDNEILFAWTQFDKPTRVKTAIATLDDGK